MSFIDFKKYKRDRLSVSERGFLTRIIPWARKIQDFTCVKADFIRLTSPQGIQAAVIASDILIQSKYGEHPLANQRYGNRGANNLSLLEVGEYWQKHILKYEEREYRSYDDWEGYAKDVSDYYVYSGNYLNVLESTDTLTQVARFSDICRDDNHWQTMIYLIKDLGLEEFNLRYETKK